MNNQSLLELMLSTEFSQHQQMHQELDNFEVILKFYLCIKEFRKYIIDLAHQVIELKEIEINQISNEENNQEEGYRNEEEEGNQRNEGNEEEGDGGSESELDWMYKAFETPGLVFLKLLTEEYLSELLHPILKQVEKPQMKEEESEGEGNEEAEEEYPSE